MDPGPTQLSISDGPSEPLPALGPGHYLGTGPFQCLGTPNKAAINPSGTLLAAVTWGGTLRDWEMIMQSWELLSIPAGTVQHLDLPPDAEPMQSIAQIAWIDDHRLLLLGYGTICIPSVETADAPWGLTVSQQPASLYQIIDVTARTRTSGSFPREERAVCFALGDERQTAQVLIERSRADPESWIGRPPHGSDPGAIGICSLDLTSGRMSEQGLTALTSRQEPWLLALRPDAGWAAVLLGRQVHANNQVVLELIDLHTAHPVEVFALPTGAEPTAIRWGVDDQHLEVLSLGAELSTWTLTLPTGIWTERPGWPLRRTHAVDPGAGVVATIGLHALTLADGRYVPLLPTAVRGVDYFHSTYRTEQLSSAGPFAVDERCAYCALTLGGVLRVLDLRHAYALSPQPSTWFDHKGAQFLADGDLMVTSAHDTTILTPSGPRHIPVQDGIQSLLAVAAGTSIGTDQQDELRVIDQRTGLGHQITSGSPPRPHARYAYLSPHGRSALLSALDGGLWLVQTGSHQLAWEMPCGRVNSNSPVAIAWSQDESIGYVAENWPFGHGPMGTPTGAWDLAQRRLLWRPTDANGEEVITASTLIPDPSSRQVLMQQFTRTGRMLLRRNALPVPQVRLSNYQLTSGLLDGSTGQWLRSVITPGERAGFTPDGARLVGLLGVVGISENRFLQGFNASTAARHLWLSPARTWVLVLPPSGDWLLGDCAQCGIRLHFSRPPPPLGDQVVVSVAWDPSEQHIALGFVTCPMVFTMPLLPEAGAAAAPTLPDPGLLAQLEAVQGWLPAAERLAALGEQGVRLLATGAMTAHRLIALELCARHGEVQADRLLDAAGSLPPPMGYLAHDCAYRIQQLRIQQQASSSSTSSGPNSDAVPSAIPTAAAAPVTPAQ